MSSASLKLDVGCGGRGSKWDGFVGIDIHPRPTGVDPRLYVRLNFVTENVHLYWQDESVDEIVALHIIEHLMPDEGEALLRKAYALLKKGAKLTVTCPNLRVLATKYLEHDSFLETPHRTSTRAIWPGPTYADRLNWAIHQEDHLWSYDTESLYALAARCGMAHAKTIDVNSRYWKTSAERNPKMFYEAGFEVTRR